MEDGLEIPAGTERALDEICDWELPPMSLEMLVGDLEDFSGSPGRAPGLFESSDTPARVAVVSSSVPLEEDPEDVIVGIADMVFTTEVILPGGSGGANAVDGCGDCCAGVVVLTLLVGSTCAG